MRDEISPDHILQIGFGFWPSKTLLSAVELELFSLLADGPKTGLELQGAMGLHPRATYDFLDTLVALGLLQRDGAGKTSKYGNTPSTARFLVKQSPQYIGGVLEMANARLYRFWADLTPALKTGKPQNEIKETGKSMFGELYADPARLEQFMDAMSGISMGNFAAFAEKFDFSKYKTLADIGGATGQLSAIVAARHPHMQCQTCDLADVQPIAERRVEGAQSRRPGHRRDDRLLRGRVSQGGHHHDGNDSSRLESREQEDAHRQGLPCIASRRRTGRHREHHRR